MYKALKSFSGLISMAEGEKKDISNDFIINDLVKAGYIEEVKPAKSKETAKKATLKKKLLLKTISNN